MLTFRYPTAALVADFLVRHRDAPLSYAHAGSTHGEAPAGFNVDRYRRRVGDGDAAFARGCDAIRRWLPHQQGWAWSEPRDIPPAPGVVVAVAARVAGCWWLNGCRVEYAVDETGPVRRFGFAYDTLAGNVEQGEARFALEQHPDGAVWYEVLTHSRPRHLLARLAYPLSRHYQRRFAWGACAAVQRYAKSR